MTLEELKYILQQQVDEITLLEILDISAEEIVDRFSDRIKERKAQLERDFDG